MRVKTAVGLGAASLVAGLFLVPPGTAAAQTESYPTTHVDVPYGASYTTGTLTWYNRSVELVGEEKAVESSGCRTTYVATYAADGGFLDVGPGLLVCNGSTKFSSIAYAEVPGGAASVLVCLDDAWSTHLACKRYYRP
jgi:hypothetical protein